ncbi:MAG: hypothetical protein PHH82_02385 [Candidatus ainarchaeum sp.]|nr:hypothetical protein [Candidatus ainarchaeum sp.]
MLNFDLQGKKGFTLFTALVGFIVIGITVLVLQHLDNSESNYNQIFITMQAQTEINTLKDILRLDSYSYVSLLLVERIAAYFNGQTFVLSQKPWGDQTNTFEKEYFLGTSTSTPVTNFLVNAYATQMENFSGDYKTKYKFLIYDPTQLQIPNSGIDLFGPNFKPNTALGKTSQVLSNSVKNYAAQQTTQLKLLDVVGCDDFGTELYAGECENGTFYIPLDLSKLNDPQEYENILRILIYRYLDKASLDDAILPKNKIKLYVPIRLFGAMSKFMETIDSFNTNAYEQAGLKDLSFGSCEPSCWPSSIDVKMACYQTGLDEQTCTEDTTVDGLDFVNALPPHFVQLDLENTTKLFCDDYLKKEFEDFAIETPGLEFGDCEVKLNMGDTEFYKAANYNTGQPLFTAPCNYLDSVEIQFSIVDINPLFMFDTPITYVFDIVLDNRGYTSTLGLPKSVTCSYTQSSGVMLTLDSEQVDYQ